MPTDYLTALSALSAAAEAVLDAFPHGGEAHGYPSWAPCWGDVLVDLQRWQAAEVAVRADVPAEADVSDMRILPLPSGDWARREPRPVPVDVRPGTRGHRWVACDVLDLTAAHRHEAWLPGVLAEMVDTRPGGSVQACDGVVQLRRMVREDAGFVDPDEARSLAAIAQSNLLTALDAWHELGNDLALGPAARADYVLGAYRENVGDTVREKGGRKVHVAIALQHYDAQVAAMPARDTLVAAIRRQARQDAIRAAYAAAVDALHEGIAPDIDDGAALDEAAADLFGAVTELAAWLETAQADADQARLDALDAD